MKVQNRKSFPSDSAIKNLLERWIQSLGQEDPPEKKMETQFSIVVWEIPWTEEPGGLHSVGVTKSWTQLSK